MFYILLVILAAFFGVIGILVLGFILLIRHGKFDPPSIRPSN